MNTVDTKLQAMENQLRKLTLDFHQACGKQEQNTEALSKRLENLKKQLDDTRSTVSSAPSPTTAFSSYPKLSGDSSMSSPFTPPSPAFNNNPAPRNTHEDTDAEIAKKLQEEFDKEQQQQQQQQRQPPQNSFNAPVYQQAPSYPQPQASAPAPVQSPGTAEKEACPVCGLSFTVGKELMEHANSHFEAVQQQRPTQPQQQQMQTAGKPEEPGFFAKLFGKPKQEVRPPVYYSSGQPQQPQQMPPQQMPQQQGARPANQYYQVPSSNGQQPVYVGPNGNPVYMQQPQQRF